LSRTRGQWLNGGQHHGSHDDVGHRSQRHPNHAPHFQNLNDLGMPTTSFSRTTATVPSRSTNRRTPESVHLAERDSRRALICFVSSTRPAGLLSYLMCRR
jgi:hypothetical protein